MTDSIRTLVLAVSLNPKKPYRQMVQAIQSVRASALLIKALKRVIGAAKRFQPAGQVVFTTVYIFMPEAVKATRAEQEMKYRHLPIALRGKGKHVQRRKVMKRFSVSTFAFLIVIAFSGLSSVDAGYITGGRVWLNLAIIMRKILEILGGLSMTA